MISDSIGIAAFHGQPADVTLTELQLVIENHCNTQALHWHD